MKCPTVEELLRAEFGELLTHRASEVERHVAACASCTGLQRDQRELLSALAASPQLPLSDPQFVLGVMARLDESRRASVELPRRSVRWIVGVAAVAAMAAAVMMVPRLVQHEDAFAARGSKRHESTSTFVEVLRVRPNGLEPIRGTTLRPGDGIGVRFANPSKMSRFLMVFLVDGQGEVHWIYPAYVDPASNPTSVLLAPDSALQLLDETVEPAAPAPGPLRVATLVTAQPLTVKEVEARIRGQVPDLERLFPSAQVNDWGCTWLAK
jgi:hypothetical protein